ncbi:MAG TPA: T9SS type A sorting domain-containing protein [Flavobacterium sp.]|nr:T9SS type A sorting domain-containing protein [Flavobacterium sp.]
MRNLFCCISLAFCTSLWAQTVTAIEYFINADPGLGAAIPVTGFTPSANVAFNVSLPVNLDSGTHYLGYRTMDNSGIWSLTNFKRLYVVGYPPAAINALEYFFDIDQGIGANTILPFDGNSTNIVASVQELMVPQALTLGEHLLLMRTRDAYGRYSLTNVSQPITVVELGLDDLAANGIVLFPNPVVDELNISLQESDPVRIWMFDMAGRCVRDVYISQSTSVNIADLPTGIYNLSVWKDKGKIFTHRIVKN